MGIEYKQRTISLILEKTEDLSLTSWLVSPFFLQPLFQKEYSLLPCFHPVKTEYMFQLMSLLIFKSVAQMVKHLPAIWETRVLSWVGKITWRRKWQPTPGPLPGKSRGWRSLVCYSPCGRKELDTTERLHLPFSIIYNLLTVFIVCFSFVSM